MNTSLRTARRPVPILMALVLAGCGAGMASPAAPTDAPSPSAVAAVPSPTPDSTPVPQRTPTLRTPPPFELLPTMPTTPLDDATVAKLQEVLDTLVARGAPDAIATVITADGLWSGAAGIDGPDGRAADPGDEFSVASITKPILAALILRLAQDGKLDLDAPMSTYLADSSVDSNGATVRQALAMRAGIGETPSQDLVDARADCGRIWTREETEARIPAPNAEPGAEYAYSNPTYKLLGYLAEDVTGTPLDVAFNDLMFAPLGLDRILFQTSTRPTPTPWALPVAGHSGALALAAYGVGGTLPCLSLTTFSFGSAVASDAPSLARWGWGLFSGSLIDRDSLLAMTTVNGSNWGLGIERLSDFSALAFGTRGHQDGYNSFIVILPERQAVAVLFINDGGADVQAGARQLIRALGE